MLLFITCMHEKRKGLNSFSHCKTIFTYLYFFKLSYITKKAGPQGGIFKPLSRA